jgi:hypothetical protein
MPVTSAKRTATEPEPFSFYEGEKQDYRLDADNRQHILRELEKEEAQARKLTKKGLLHAGNGLTAFVEACRRRIGVKETFGAYRYRTLMKHSAQVEFTCRCVARGMPTEATRIITAAGFCHDVGHTMLLPTLRGSRDHEMTAGALRTLRTSHLQAGVLLLDLYRGFMEPQEHELARLVIEAHHVAYDGKGTKNAPSYPERVGERGKYIVAEEILKSPHTRVVRKNLLPEVVRIAHTADVFSAVILKKRPAVKDRLGGLTGHPEIDAALAVLVTVAGTDLDPEMVRRLMVHGFGVPKLTANLILKNLPCEEISELREESKDMRHAQQVVLTDEHFQRVQPGRKELASDLLADTRVAFFNVRKLVD